VRAALERDDLDRAARDPLGLRGRAHPGRIRSDDNSPLGHRISARHPPGRIATRAATGQAAPVAVRISVPARTALVTGVLSAISASFARWSSSQSVGPRPAPSRRHAGLRRHRRRQASQPDTDLHGGGSQPCGQKLQPLRIHRPQAGLHLRIAGPGPTELTRNFGIAWGIGGWLLTSFLQKIGPESIERLRRRVAGELTTTFASSYTDRVSLTDALRLEAITAYARQATGSKYLIIPSL